MARCTADRGSFGVHEVLAGETEAKKRQNESEAVGSTQARPNESEARGGVGTWGSAERSALLRHQRERRQLVEVGDDTRAPPVIEPGEKGGRGLLSTRVGPAQRRERKARGPTE